MKNSEKPKEPVSVIRKTQPAGADGLKGAGNSSAETLDLKLFIFATAILFAYESPSLQRCLQESAGPLGNMPLPCAIKAATKPCNISQLIDFLSNMLIYLFVCFLFEISQASIYLLNVDIGVIKRC